MTYSICDSQAFAIHRGAAFQLLDDAPAFRLHRGDWLAMKPASGYACDALHLLKSGEIVNIQMASGGYVRVTRGDGSDELVTVAETREMVIGYAVERLTRAG